MRNNLSKNGLSLSQAQSISNLCHQRAVNIENTLEAINNASESFQLAGETYFQKQGNPIPGNIISLVLEKGKLHATQAYLMENIKAKNDLLQSLKSEKFKYSEPEPEELELESPKLEELVDEFWGWKQLSASEHAEYLEVEAYAAHIGKFIHNRSKLSELRRELASLPLIKWIEVSTEAKTPVKVTSHHTSSQLEELHEKFASLHMTYEQRVNYYKAKVANLVTNENARIANVNAKELERVTAINNKIMQENTQKYVAWSEAKRIASEKFEEQRQKEISEVASLRISIDPRFQPTIDLFLPKDKKEQ